MITNVSNVVLHYIKNYLRQNTHFLKVRKLDFIFIRLTSYIYKCTPYVLTSNTTTATTTFLKLTKHLCSFESFKLSAALNKGKAHLTPKNIENG